METEKTKGKSFKWKKEHPTTSKPIRTIFKVESTKKDEPQRLTAEEFPPAFIESKEGE